MRIVTIKFIKIAIFYHRLEEHFYDGRWNPITSTLMEMRSGNLSLFASFLVASCATTMGRVPSQFGNSSTTPPSGVNSVAVVSVPACEKALESPAVAGVYDCGVGDKNSPPVLLRNGVFMSQSVVTAGMEKLKSLSNRHPPGFADVVLKSRDAETKFTNALVEEDLKRFGFLTPEGLVRPEIANLVLSSLPTLSFKVVDPNARHVVWLSPEKELLQSPQESGEVVQLNSGEIMRKQILDSVTEKMKTLLNRNPMAFTDVVLKAREPGHTFYNKLVADYLRENDFLTDNDFIRPEICKVVILAMSEFRVGDLKPIIFKDPVKKVYRSISDFRASLP